MRESGQHSSVFVALVALIVAAGATHAPRAQAQAPNVAQACVYRPNIDHTRVLDDRTILFFMRDRAIYQNTLKDQCYSLKSVNRFAYGEASLHRICAGNWISVIQSVTPGAISQNNSCRLGAFVPVDQDVVDELIAAADPSGKNKSGDKRAIQVVPVESPPATPEHPQPSNSDASTSAPPSSELAPKIEPSPAVEPAPASEPSQATDPGR